MSDELKQCPKCPGKMAQGFIPDFTHSAVLVEGWHPGNPKKSFWQRTKVKIDEVIPIGAFRCKLCGFLEFYAHKNYAAEK